MNSCLLLCYICSICVSRYVGKGRPCMKMLKKVSESTEPCGTPFGSVSWYMVSHFFFVDSVGVSNCEEVRQPFSVVSVDVRSYNFLNE